VPVTSDRVARLKTFGLTEYEARVYLALLDLGTANAVQVPPHSGVPRTRIYGTMSQLHDRGLVEILPESPRRYKPVPFSSYLTKLAGEHKERARRLEEDLQDLGREFAVRAEAEPEKRGRFEAIRGRRNARERLVKMYSAASHLVIAIGTANSPRRIRTALSAQLLEKWKQGVQIRYAFPITDENGEDIARLSEHAEVRNVDFLMPVYLHVVDAREFMMSHPIPDDESFYRGDDISIWSDDPAIAGAISLMAQRMWEAGAKPGPMRARRPLRRVD
jgi:sugar-specific transcriptional regulator TrmB